MVSAKGLGLAGYGSSQYGYGTPATVNSTTAKLLLKTDGTYGNVPKIDPNTKDFVLDENGNKIGDNSVNQMVYLALRTYKNASAVLGFGIDINKVKVINDNIQVKIQLMVSEALSDLISRKMITLDKVLVTRVKQTAIQVDVLWTDLTNNSQNTFKLIG